MVNVKEVARVLQRPGEAVKVLRKPREVAQEYNKSDSRNGVPVIGAMTKRRRVFEIIMLNSRSVRKRAGAPGAIYMNGMDHAEDF